MGGRTIRGREDNSWAGGQFVGGTTIRGAHEDKTGGQAGGWGTGAELVLADGGHGGSEEALEVGGDGGVFGGGLYGLLGYGAGIA